MNGSFPPIIADGSKPLPISTCESIAVVVVLPCVPETAILLLYLLVTIPSITLLSMHGIPSSFAACLSGLVSLIAAE